jgi:FkbM family methyltransferase
MRSLYATAFHALCRIGRPIGGMRPRRVYHWLAQRAYDRAPRPEEFHWCRDRWGHRFLVHPYYHIDRHILFAGAFEADLLRFLERRVRPGMVCFDVGANLGQVTIHLGGLVGAGGRVHAFEPMPPVLERLRGHVEANDMAGRVRLHEVALSDTNGTARFHGSDAAGENQGQGSLVSDLAVSAREIEVRTQRLDDFVAEHGIERLDLMKIDIQGAEPLLLAGAERTLAELRPDIVMEVSPEDLGFLGRTSRDLLRMLEARDYVARELLDARVGRTLRATEVAEDYSAANVLCTHRKKS